MRFSIFCSLFFFAFTDLKEVCNSNDKNPNGNIWIQKIPLFKVADSPLKNVRAEKRGSKNWSKIRWFSFQKIDLHFDHWNLGPHWSFLKDIRGRNILPVITAIKRGSAFNHHSYENGSTIDVFLIFLCKHKSTDGIEMASIVVKFCFYSSSIVS